MPVANDAISGRSSRQAKRSSMSLPRPPVESCTIISGRLGEDAVAHLAVPRGVGAGPLLVVADVHVADRRARVERLDRRRRPGRSGPPERPGCPRVVGTAPVIATVIIAGVVMHCLLWDRVGSAGWSAR